jgi:hypothetical protein
MYFDNCKSQAEAKARFRVYTKAFHPDRNGGSDEMFKEMNEEYEKFISKKTTNVVEKEPETIIEKVDFLEGMLTRGIISIGEYAIEQLRKNLK